MKKKKRKVKKLRVKRFLAFLIFLISIVLLISYIINLKIERITVEGNTLYSDWEIIKQAQLNNYPSNIKCLPTKIESNLKKYPYIKDVEVKRNSLTSINIKVDENLPLFYYVPNQKTVLENKKEVDDKFSVPTLVNYVPDKLYETFIEKMSKIDYSIVKRMSEIKYDPNDVDEERFLITMNDGNYVYLTLNKLKKINHYIKITKEFNNKKGILYLDSGEYFKVLEEG